MGAAGAVVPGREGGGTKTGLARKPNVCAIRAGSSLGKTEGSEFPMVVACHKSNELDVAN